MQDAGFGLLPQEIQDQLREGAQVTGPAGLDNPRGMIPDSFAYARMAEHGIGQEDAQRLFEVIRGIQQRQQAATAGA